MGLAGAAANSPASGLTEIRRLDVDSVASAPTVRKTFTYKTFTYKLHPTPEQERLFDRTLMRCRHVYNAAIGERREAWRMRTVSITYYQQKAELPEIKAAMPEYGEVNGQVLQDVVQRVERAFQGFFRRLREGQKPGYPRFQGRTRYHSFTYPQVGEHGSARLDNGLLVLSTIGRVAIRWSRALEGTPKTVTISREADGWYVGFSCADVTVQPLPPTDQDTGIDVGLAAFATLADGSQIANPRIFRIAEMALKRAQRRVSRRKKGSHRRRKAVALLAKAHQTVRRQRTDFHHKTALALVCQYDTIYLEDLQPANLVRNPYLAKSISDAARARFRTLLEGKAAYVGRRVIAVPPAYTSQDCSGCGERVPKSLSMRTHICTNCGLVMDRDENAALNILRAGQALQALTQRDAAYVA
jgi:putative transposase